MIDLRRMQHAVVLARVGSYVGAAQALGLTQPALSRSIQSIEADYGLRLFDRGRGGVVATDAGAEFVARAEQLLIDARALDDIMRGQLDGTAGEVRFGMGPLIASACLKDALPRLLSMFPSIHLRATIGGSAALLDQILGGAMQFAICAGEGLPRGDFAIEPMGRLPLCLIARAGHPLGTGGVHVADLAGFPLVGGSIDDRVVAMENDYAPQLVCDNYEILRSVTLSSDTLWLTSPAVVMRELSEGTMLKIDCVDLVSDSYEVVLISRRRGAMSRAATLILDDLRAELTPHFAEEPPPL
ncbi:transcriptional regulator [Novosphingobium endophyticum]|uniref:Transcriptional regulator n=2 Tax=Novosphingobium endophyticum TaxID=1955250 RepID=A0A916X5T2_9SPHN|nr:transcriptional regulator [Novosphingobium endophyticum]